MPISVLDVAKYFLTKGKTSTNEAITHLKLQKLVYYAQGYHLAVFGEALFADSIEAWVHGPVCPVLYNTYRFYGYSEIPAPKGIPNIPDNAKVIIDMAWDVFGQYEGPDLERFTHQEEPWIRAREGLQLNQNTNKEIDITIIKTYFRKVLNGGI
jgi:Uncharacterized phage-associated protein